VQCWTAVGTVSNHDVAAVVLAHNSGDVITRVVSAIRDQTAPPGVIVVVDNGSQDATAERVASEEGVELVALPDNVGVGAGHNRGWTEARRHRPAAIWVLEHDTVPQPDCLRLLLETLNDELGAGAAVGAVLPRQLPTHLIDAPPPALGRRGRLSLNGPLIPVGVLDEVGPLREDFFVGQEDREFEFRLRAAGLSVVRHPSALVEHANVVRPRPGSVLRSYYGRRNEAYLSVHVRRDPFARTRASIRAVGGIVRSAVLHDQKWNRIRARTRAAVDGIRGDLGAKSYPFLSRG
jgi:rhamnopyranosyl-N-acetylglucosaminyl-diphospho-decaprenol beta-1,3/1,4-galactofuranosyltransferase